jgi:plastocyanin
VPIIDIWIQLENHAWDSCPNNIDRMTGQNLEMITGKAPVVKTLVSPVTGFSHDQTMFRPLSKDALILRRYSANWAAPDDRKVNPWDQNEPDPTDSGTMGTIPGPTIECSIGDKVRVHFRNMDSRVDMDGSALSVESRTHSLHPHGFAFAPTSDGAYPLSPPDLTQPIDSTETAAWASVGVTRFKQGDRVPPEGTFTYTWDTVGWPTTAGVWLYHDHSICADHNIEQGVIGIIVIHNPRDSQDVISPDLPGGSPTGSPTEIICFPTPPGQQPPQQLLEGAESVSRPPQGHETGSTGHQGEPITGEDYTAKPPSKVGPPILTRLIKHENLQFELDETLRIVGRVCLPFYRRPPDKAQYLLLFHSFSDSGMYINGRTFMGNTPTLIAGPRTQMRFGVVGMGSDFHTFHLHGHRWVIPGPDGADPNTIQNSPEVTAVSQFEDTKIFGPANSFSFTINEGSFMGALPGAVQGEWHLHCHVLNHMMQGMMGSLKVINGGEPALPAPSGVPCPDMGGLPGQVNIRDNFFSPTNLMISTGQTVHWINGGSGSHTVTSNPGSFGCSPSSMESFDSGTLLPGATFDHTFNQSGTFSYHCEVHGCAMAGTVMVM